MSRAAADMTIPDHRLIENILDDYGFDELGTFLEEHAFDFVVPGACRACGHVQDDCDPDSHSTNCENCNDNSVVSVIELALFY